MGRENSFKVRPIPLTPFPAIPPDQNHQIGKTSQCNGAVHIRQRGRKRHGASHRGNRLKSEQFKQRAHKDVSPCSKDVRPQKSVALGAAGLCHAVKHTDRLFQQYLKPAGNHLKAGDDEDTDARRRNQQDSRNRHGRNQARIHVFPPQQADLVVLMQNSVPHGSLDGFRLSR